MAKTQARIKFTYEDYQSLPYVEGVRYELLDGELIRLTPAPNEAHQRISLQFAYRLMQFVQENNRGKIYVAPFDVVLGEPGEEEVAEPDILFVSKERRRIIREDAVHGAPDLVIEILSPSTAEKDKTYKRRLYAKHGVKEYWIVDPDEEIVEILTIRRNGYDRTKLYKKEEVLTSPLLPGLRLALKEIF
jgi:Uma2 family endonuclease